MEILAAFWFIACPIIAGIVGAQKGRAFTSILVALIFGPLGVLLAIIAKPNTARLAKLDEKNKSSAGMSQCSACYTWVDQRATICPNCKTVRQPFTTP